VSDDGDPTHSGRPGSPERLSAEAVRALYLLHGRDLQLFLTGVLKNSDAAQDVCQATFQRLLESGHEAKAETTRGWLYKVGFNEALAWRRRESQRDKLHRKAAATADQANIDLPVQSLVRTEEIEKLKRLLQDLPTEQQLVVRRRIQEDKTFAQIADELNVPLGTVLTRMRLAVQKLQKWFG
jgi:RNA polymerase sigma factor (sigma-70 family)